MKKKNIWAVAVEQFIPVDDDPKREEPPGPHKIQGIGAGFRPDILDLAWMKSQRSRTTKPLKWPAHREEGITCGISSGAAAAVAVRIAARPENKDKLIVTVLPDAGERYFSTVLFEGIQA
jgi:cysteine synthase A